MRNSWYSESTRIPIRNLNHSSWSSDKILAASEGGYGIKRSMVGCSSWFELCQWDVTMTPNVQYIKLLWVLSKPDPSQAVTFTDHPSAPVFWLLNWRKNCWLSRWTSYLLVNDLFAFNPLSQSLSVLKKHYSSDIHRNKESDSPTYVSS